MEVLDNCLKECEFLPLCSWWAPVVNKIKCTKQLCCKREHNAIQDSWSTSIREGKHGEIIVIRFLDETNLGCIVISKSFVLAELMLTGFPIPGTMKIYLWNLPVWCICACLCLSQHSWSSTGTHAPHTHAQSAQHAVTEQTGTGTTDAQLKANCKMPEMTRKGHIPLPSGLNKAHVGEVVCLLNRSALLQGKEETNIGRCKLRQFGKQQCLFWQHLTSWAWVGRIFLGFKTIVSTLTMPKVCQQINAVSGVGENSSSK